MRNTNQKYLLKCKLCSTEIDSFKQWFEYAQRCPECGSNQADVRYLPKSPNIHDLFNNRPSSFKGMWFYFDFLPLDNPENIVSAGEGIVPIDRWKFLEEYAKDAYNLRIKIYAHRHDNNYATGTFTDPARKSLE